MQFGDLGLGTLAVEPVEPGADLGVIGAVSGGGEQLTQFLFGDVGRQDLRALGSLSIRVFHIAANALWGSRSRAVSSRRRLALGVLFAGPAAVVLKVTRRRTAVSASLASLTRWKWSTTSTALGSSSAVTAAA